MKKTVVYLSVYPQKDGKKTKWYIQYANKFGIYPQSGGGPFDTRQDADDYASKNFKVKPTYSNQ